MALLSDGAVFFGYYLHDIHPTMFPPGAEVGIRWYGFSYVAAFASAFWLMRWLADRGYGQLKRPEVADFITLCALFGVVLGGRLGYMLLYNVDEFWRNPLQVLKIWDGGMASHGGISGVLIFTLVYAWRKGYNWPGVGDNLVSVAPLGIFFGRIANFINGELYGKPTEVRWAVQFPEALERDEDAFNAAVDRLPTYWEQAMANSPSAWQAEYAFQSLMKSAVRTDENVHQVLSEVLVPRHPSQIYQALMEGLLLFLILFGLRVAFKKLGYGILTGLFFIGYALMRILGEVYREPDLGKSFIMGLQRGQFYSIFMFAVGAGFLIYGFTAGRKAVLKSSEN